MNQKYAELENALVQALAAVQKLGPMAEKKAVGGDQDAKASIPPDRLKEVTENIQAAAEMGDVAQIQSIAEALKAEFEALAPFCDEIVRLAEDFDFDGIQKCMLEFDN